MDIEANGLHAYREQTCVIQVTRRGPQHDHRRRRAGRTDLRCATPSTGTRSRWLFHGGDYDIAMLYAGPRLRFHRVFDTMIAATLLGDGEGRARPTSSARPTACSSTSATRTRTGHASLTPEQIDYLHRDTAYLPRPLRDLRASASRRRTWWRRPRSSFDASPTAIGKLAGLRSRRLAPHQGRLEARRPRPGRAGRAARLAGSGGATARHRPPFKILSPRAPGRPGRARAGTHARTRSDLAALRPTERARCGRPGSWTSSAACRSRDDGETPPAAAIRPRLTPEEERASRERRRARGGATRVAPQGGRRAQGAQPRRPAQPGLAWIVRDTTEHVEALAEHEDIGAKRAARYGEAILTVLEKAGRPAT